MYNETQKKATMKYQKEKQEILSIRVPKGERSNVQAAADEAGISMRQYIIEAINEHAGKQLLTPSTK
jgi:predicted HicB family RNase H-like nuclease